MSAEEIDKLFKSKLENRSVAPGNDVWERMQARLQPPVEEKERRPVMWYYSAAAAITMLISVGVWSIRQGSGVLQTSGSVAVVKQPKTTSPAQNIVETESQKKDSEDQATVLTPLASSSQEGLVAKAETSKQEKTIAYPSSTPKRIGTTTLENEEKTGFQNQTTSLVAVAPAKETQTAATPQELPLEIIIKLDNNHGEAVALATPVTQEEPAEEKGNGRVLRGILKQVKNLKDGEKVSLSELGITKHTYALETKIGNKTITKTIQL